LDVIGEFDGQGVNLGIRIPITTDYRIQIGFVHLESLPDIVGNEGETLTDTEGPAVVFGLDLSVPRIEARRAAVKAEAAAEVAGMGPRVEPELYDESLLVRQMDSTLKAAEYLMADLRDSLRIAQFEIDNTHDQVAMLEQERVVLSDSVRAMQLRNRIGSSPRCH